jgi:hypothetical protein
LEGYEYDAEYWNRFRADVLLELGMFLEYVKRVVMESVLRVMEPAVDPWSVRFTIVYRDGVADYVYDNVVRKMFVAPFNDALFVLIKHGDIGVVDYSERGSKMLVRKERVVEDLKDRLIEMLREAVERKFGF